MKNTRIFSPLMWLLLGSVALAQAGTVEVPEAPQPQELAAAKIESAKVHAPKIEPTAEPQAGAYSEGKLISHAQRYPQLHPGRMRPPGQAYRSPAPMPRLSPLGALIGFATGAALGASKSQDQSAGARAVIGLFVGGIGALIGGAIGSGPTVWHRRRPPYGDDEDDDDSNLRSERSTVEAKRPITKEPAAQSPSPALESAALAPLEELAIP